jgi:hypothetical protein
MHWSYLIAASNVSTGPIWKQVLATSVSYGVFLAALTAAVFLRRWLIIRPRDPATPVASGLSETTR